MFALVAVAGFAALVSVSLANGGAPYAEEFGGNALIVIDGDTVALPCKPESGFRRGCAVKVRLKDVDTPETLHPHCEEELVKGLEAKARLRELLRGQLVTVMHSGETDRYHRSLGWLTFEDRSDVASILVQEGLALHWKAGSAAKASRIAHWCGAHR
jgi:endonuclease YncB( thermonuclease family)